MIFWTEKLLALRVGQDHSREHRSSKAQAASAAFAGTIAEESAMYMHPGTF